MISSCAFLVLVECCKIRAWFKDQLVEYISSQVKLGVARETIKSALVNTGWPAADVEDTLKKVEGTSAAPSGSAPTSAASVSASPKPASMSASMSPSMLSASQKSAGSQTIRMSDLVSVNAAVGSAAKGNSSSASSKMAPIDLGTLQETKTKAPRGGHIMMIVGIIIILAVGGLAGFLYLQNNTLTGRIASLGSESTDLASRISSLNTQVQAFDASNTALAAQVASLTTENAYLLANLSFVVALPLSSSTAATGTVSMSGTLASGKSSYVLTTVYGVMVFVANMKDASVTAALKPLLGSTSTVMLTGTHVPGSQYITVTGVNGSTLQ